MRVTSAAEYREKQRRREASRPVHVERKAKPRLLPRLNIGVSMTNAFCTPPKNQLNVHHLPPVIKSFRYRTGRDQFCRGDERPAPLHPTN